MKLKPTLIILAGFACVVGLALAVATHGQAADFDLNKVKVGDGVPKSITGKPGDPKQGRKAAINRKRGNCLACHILPVPEQADHGNIGPSLSDVASRMSEAEIRLRLIDPKVSNPDTIMPSFYKKTGFHRVQKKWQGKTILKAQDIEDIVAYLLTLKE